jgi:hypothetical protein
MNFIGIEIFDVLPEVLEKVHGTTKPDVYDDNFIDKWLEYYNFSERRTQELDCLSPEDNAKLKEALKRAGDGSFYLLAFCAGCGSKLNFEIYT